MSKDQGARRYLDIPGEKTLIYTFKFNMDLPAPVPPPKTMYIPLDPERYIKPKLTLFHVKRKANLLSDINLSIPVDEVNMRPELYNPAPDAKFELTDKDRELLEEKPTAKKEETAKAQGTNGKPQTAGQKDKDAAAKAQPSTKAKPDAAQTKKPEAAQAPKKKEEQKNLSIDDYVKKTFEVSSTYTTGMKHPSKEGLQCQEVFEILPDFNNIITELYTVKAEVSAETIKSKENLIKFETDLDKKPIVGVYVSAPLGEGTSQGMEEEKESVEGLLKRVENFEHFGNYMYSNPKPHGTIKRDLLLNVNKSTGKALIYQPHSLILKKKKVLFMAKTIYKEEDMEDERKPKEKKRTIKILKRDLDKDELLLKKKKFKELQLENTSMYKKNNKDLESYKEPEEDELDILRKRFVVEEEEEEEENQGEEEEKVEEEEEPGYGGEDKGSNQDRESHREEEKEERNEPMEEEAQYNEEAKEQKPAKAGSEDGDAQELADFFADSDDDEDD